MRRYERSKFVKEDADRRAAELPRVPCIGGPFDGHEKATDDPREFRVLRRGMQPMPSKRRPPSHFANYRVLRITDGAGLWMLAFVEEHTTAADAEKFARERKLFTSQKRIHGPMPQGHEFERREAAE